MTINNKYYYCKCKTPNYSKWNNIIFTRQVDILLKRIIRIIDKKSNNIPKLIELYDILNNATYSDKYCINCLNKLCNEIKDILNKK